MSCQHICKKTNHQCKWFCKYPDDFDNLHQRKKRVALKYVIIGQKISFQYLLFPEKFVIRNVMIANNESNRNVTGYVCSTRDMGISPINC